MVWVNRCLSYFVVVTVYIRIILAEGWQGGIGPSHHEKPPPRHDKEWWDIGARRRPRRHETQSSPLRNTPTNDDHSSYNAPWARGGHARIAKRPRPFAPRAASHSAYYTYTTTTNHPYYHQKRLVRTPSSKGFKREQQRKPTSIQKPRIRSKTGNSSRMATMVGFAYFFTAICINLPIVLLPTIAAEKASVLGPTFVPAAFVAAAASTVTMGGGLGKIVNGIVCQVLGGTTSMLVYMTGIAAASFCFSCLSSSAASQSFGWCLAGMEFLWSIQWTACSVVLANHYAHDAARFAASVTTLSLMSTAGTILSKVGGTALLSALGSWRLVARFGSLTALAGAAVAFCFVEEMPARKRGSLVLHAAAKQKDTNITSSSRSSLIQPFRQVLGSRLFWLVGLAHAPAFLARTSDRVLGSFYVTTSGLSRSVCGGLTTSCTLGFVHGLSRGRIFHRLKHKHQQIQFLRRNYAVAAVSALGLALCGGPWLPDLVTSRPLRAAIVAVFSGVMTSCLSFQFYQIPNIVASSPEFQNSKAMFLSLIDCLGYLVATPVWAMTGVVVSRFSAGWAVAWIMLSLFYLAGGRLMVRNMEPLLRQD